MKTSREFYVGYSPSAPAGVSRFIRRIVLVLLVIAATAGAALGLFQRKLPAAVFEWNQPRAFTGVIHETPAPSLAVIRPGTQQVSRYLLVTAGKHGAAAEIEGFEGARVQLQGSLVYRENRTMIELVADSIERVAQPAVSHRLQREALGRHTFTGEIVDSKCYLGVMNPGNTKVHRACATRCISGGIPPVLMVRQADGSALYLLLVDSVGEPVNQRVLSMVAEAVEITGELERIDDLLVLRADPSTYRRL